MGQNLDHDPRTQELARVQLDDMDSLDLYENKGSKQRPLEKLWETGEPIDHILGGMGFGMFEVKVEDHARRALGIDGSFTVIQATRDAEQGDSIVCAYGAFHPLLIRRRAEWVIEGLTMQKFCGPTVLWNRKADPSATRTAKSVTDAVAASIGFARWKPDPSAMRNRTLGNEVTFDLF